MDKLWSKVKGRSRSKSKGSAANSKASSRRTSFLKSKPKRTLTSNGDSSSSEDSIPEITLTPGNHSPGNIQEKQTSQSETSDEEDVYKVHTNETALYLGIDPMTEENLMWIAEEAANAELPSGWYEATTDDGTTYYYNEELQQSVWEHPKDEHYRNLIREERAKLLSKNVNDDDVRASLGRKQVSEKIDVEKWASDELEKENETLKDELQATLTKVESLNDQVLEKDHVISEMETERLILRDKILKSEQIKKDNAALNRKLDGAFKDEMKLKSELMRLQNNSIQDTARSEDSSATMHNEVMTLQLEIKRCKQEMHKLQDENSHLKIEAKNTDRQELEAENDMLRSELDLYELRKSKGVKNAMSSEEMIQIKKENSSLKAKIHTLNTELMRKVENYKKLNDNDQNPAKNVHYQELEDEIESLRGELKLYKLRNLNPVLEETAETNEILEIRKEKENLMIKKATLEAEVHHEAEKNKALQIDNKNDISKLKTENDQLLLKQRTLKNQLQELETTVSSLNDQLSDRNQTLTKQQAKLEILKSQDFRDKVSDLTKEINLLQQESNDLMASKHDQALTINDLKNVISKEQRVFEEKEKLFIREKELLTTQLSQLKSQTKDHKISLDDLKDQLDSSIKQVQNYQEKIRTLEATAETEKVLIGNLRKKESGLTCKLETLKAENKFHNEMKKDVSVLEAKLKTKSQECLKLQETRASEVNKVNAAGVNPKLSEDFTKSFDFIKLKQRVNDLEKKALFGKETKIKNLRENDLTKEVSGMLEESKTLSKLCHSFKRENKNLNLRLLQQNEEIKRIKQKKIDEAAQRKKMEEENQNRMNSNIMSSLNQQIFDLRQQCRMITTDDFMITPPSSFQVPYPQNRTNWRNDATCLNFESPPHDVSEKFDEDRFQEIEEKLEKRRNRLFSIVSESNL